MEYDEYYCDCCGEIGGYMQDNGDESHTCLMCLIMLDDGAIIDDQYYD